MLRVRVQLRPLVLRVSGVPRYTMHKVSDERWTYQGLGYQGIEMRASHGCGNYDKLFNRAQVTTAKGKRLTTSHILDPVPTMMDEMGDGVHWKNCQNESTEG